MLTQEEFESLLSSVLSGELDEDAIIEALTKLRDDKAKALALKSKKVADFFNRTDTNTPTEEEKELESTEIIETKEDDEVKEEKIEDLFEDEEEEEDA